MTTKKPKIIISQTKPEVQVPPVKSTADKIWDDIKNVELEMFALPGQILSTYCSQVKVNPDKLYLEPKKNIGALLPTLENVLIKKYTVERVDRFIVVSHKVTE